jgi:hypothetical protein
LRGDAQWFHFVPFASLLLLISIPFLTVSKISLIPLVGLYFLGLSIAVGSIVLNEEKLFRKIPVLSFLIITIHFHYALGVSKGLLFETFNKLNRAGS